MSAFPFAQKFRTIQELIDCGKLFPASDLLNSENAESNQGEAEVDHGQDTKMV